MTKIGRISLPDWPRLMKEQQAADYLSIGTSTLRKAGPPPKRYGRRVLYDRLDLDRWANALDGQPLSKEEREAESAALLDRIRRRLTDGEG